MIDGARNALLGYLYQIIGVASIRVRVVAEGDDVWADVVAKVREGRLRFEELGQDATIQPLGIPGKGKVAIQFKYSATPGSSIGRSEFIDILVNLDRSRREAESAGETIERYALVSNRKLKENARQLINQAKASKRPPAALRIKSTSTKGKVNKKEAKRLADFSGNSDQASECLLTILKNLDVMTGQTLEADLSRLRDFAASFGVLDAEWNERLNALVGAFVRETAENGTIEITPEWLKSHLFGNANAANLRFGSPFQPHIAARCEAALCNRLRNQHSIRLDYCLPRSIEQAIAAELMLNTVVFVHGDGGCGKSLSVIQYLRSVCGSQVVWCESADTATEENIVSDINSMRLKNGNGVDTSLANVRDRLNEANRGKSSIWTIDLDGVDEAPLRVRDLRQLIKRCWAEGNQAHSPASLIVTCRSPDGRHSKNQLVSEWFNTAEPDLIQGVGAVWVGEFGDADLIEAARLIGGKPEEKIIDALESEVEIYSHGFKSGPPMPGAPWFRQPRPDSVGSDFIRALRHPVLWGSYASSDENERGGILNGDPRYLGTLAKRFVDRFFIRCSTRKNWSDPQMLREGLRRTAQSLIHSPPYDLADWEKGCSPALGCAEARMLYQESLGYGLIERHAPGQWRWKHRFLTDYLVKQLATGGGI